MALPGNVNAPLSLKQVVHKTPSWSKYRYLFSHYTASLRLVAATSGWFNMCIGEYDLRVKSVCISSGPASWMYRVHSSSPAYKTWRHLSSWGPVLDDICRNPPTWEFLNSTASCVARSYLQLAVLKCTWLTLGRGFILLVQSKRFPNISIKHCNAKCITEWQAGGYWIFIFFHIHALLLKTEPISGIFSWFWDFQSWVCSRFTTTYPEGGVESVS